MPTALPDELHERVKALCAAGDALQESGEYPEALSKYEEALALLPEPKAEWEATTWIMAAVADVYFFQENWQQCYRVVQDAFKFAGGAIGNPFLHLRAGQASLELGETESAKRWLASAWMAGGDEVFAGERPKYWCFIREILRPSANEVPDE